MTQRTQLNMHQNPFPDYTSASAKTALPRKRFSKKTLGLPYTGNLVGGFPKSGDPNVYPNILSLDYRDPMTVPLILGNLQLKLIQKPLP